MAIEFSIVNQITNIDFTEQDPLESYDDIKQAGVIDYILKNINPAEIEFITDCINEKIEEIYKVDNSLQGIVSQGLNKLLDKIPNDKQLKSLGKSLIKDINKLDPEKYSYITQAMGWISGKTKEGEK
jgi:YesN/AraC family two-component response regulator